MSTDLDIFKYTCSICNTRKNYVYLSRHNIRYCEECKKRAKYECKICGVPLDPNNILTKNVSVCRNCVEHGVTNVKHMNNVFGIVNRFLFKYLQMDFSSVPLFVVPEFKSDRWYVSDVMGYATYDKNSFVSVSIVKYMPKDMLKYFLIHEFTHCWQAHMGYMREYNKFVVEGFAMWMEYLYAKQNNDRNYIKSILGDDNIIYGESLRFYKYIEEKKGIQYIFDHVELLHATNQFDRFMIDGLNNILGI